MNNTNTSIVSDYAETPYSYTPHAYPYVNLSTDIPIPPPTPECSIADDCLTKFGAPDDGKHWECIDGVCVQVDDPEPPPTPPVCPLVYIKLPQKGLSAIRASVRPKLPMWLTVAYYKLGFWILNNA